MLFNSINFLIFLPVVFLLYWSCTNLRYQNLLILAASYFFYACWDFRFLGLLIFSTLIDYFSGRFIHHAASVNSKKLWLVLSIVINLGLLGMFKYYDFFATSFANALSLIGIKTNVSLLNLILPVGISFYTFHGLSYVIDIYNQKIKPERDFINYSVFVCFFPLLVAGPIERAAHLLPQFRSKRVFSLIESTDGLKQILWGFFKKVVIADSCAVYADMIFNHYEWYSGWTLILGALFFTVQIYCDFSGYSDIALGTARLFGIELLRNFSFPYFSRNMAEFWKRWHISLTTWFRDYVYIPLGGNQRGLAVTIRNTFIVFFISGLWHGANWTFILWGILNACFILPSVILSSKKVKTDFSDPAKTAPSIKDLSRMLLTFAGINLAWIIFRAENLSHAFHYMKGIMYGLARVSEYAKTIAFVHDQVGYIILSAIAVFFMIEWQGRERLYAISHFAIQRPKPVRWAFYSCMITAVLFCFETGSKEQFIYFQF